jgi:trehalose/maltose hydrolase-like predicted phosphorylase
MTPNNLAPRPSPASASVLPTLSPGPWLLIEEGFSLAREHEIESLFTVANGYVGTRGSLAEGSPLSAPATFIAGVFDIDPQAGAIPELAVAPDWMQLRVSIDGNAISIETSRLLEHRRILDMRQGMFRREWRFQDASGRITNVQGLRFASLADRHALVQSILFTPENYSARLHVEIVIAAPAARPGHVVLLAEAPLSGGPRLPNVGVLELRTGTGTRVGLAATNRLRIAKDGWHEAPMNRAGDRSDPWEIQIEMGQTYRFDRIVVLYTSRDAERPAADALDHLESVLPLGVEHLMDAQTQAWSQCWARSDVRVAGDAGAQRALRFAAYHLISAANAEDGRVSIGARALTGPAYKGHVFWDTDIFMLPFFALTDPPAARSLLMYRHHTLPAARAKARMLGYPGALYAWESADTGEETTPPYALAPDGEVLRILSGQQEHHISADVAYAVWQYWVASADETFLRDAGAEIVLETARFWASRGQFADDGRYHISCVIGPDEYHEGVDDNAYTNMMAQWNLERGVEVARLVAERWPAQWAELARRIELDDTELHRWEEIAQRMYTGLDPRTGLIEEFRGYFQLEEIDISQLPADRPPVDMLFGRDRVRASQLIKQADVVMLIYLLWDRFTPEQREANFRYYEARTAHGSSLSPAIYALVAARLGDLELAMRYFQQGAEIDLANNMGNAAAGVHAAALGGLWQAAVFGFGGLNLGDDRVIISPHCPAEWRELCFPFQWRGEHLSAVLTPETAEVASEARVPMVIGIEGGEAVTLPQAGRARWARGGDGSWNEVRYGSTEQRS